MAVTWDYQMDPSDLLDFSVDVTSLLETGETLASYSVNIPTESQLFGLSINTTNPYATTKTGNIITFWLGIDSASQSNTAFTSGVTMPVEINTVSNSTPPRKKQRSVGIRVIQK